MGIDASRRVWAGARKLLIRGRFQTLALRMGRTRKVPRLGASARERAVVSNRAAGTSRRYLTR